MRLPIRLLWRVKMALFRDLRRRPEPLRLKRHVAPAVLDLSDAEPGPRIHSEFNFKTYALQGDDG